MGADPLAELGALAGQDLSELDPHRPFVDDVEIPSPTGEEAAVGRQVATILRNLDLRVDQQQVAPERFNLIATASAPATTPISC